MGLAAVLGGEAEEDDAAVAEGDVDDGGLAFEVLGAEQPAALQEVGRGVSAGDGGGLALAMGMTESGLAGWMGKMLLPLAAVPLPIVALVLVGFVVVITEFASNVAAASGIMPVVGALVAALGADPMLLALPAAFAASWGFMLPSGTGPNAIAWGTGHISLPRVLRAALMLDIAGIVLIVGVIWTISSML